MSTMRLAGLALVLSTMVSASFAQAPAPRLAASAVDSKLVELQSDPKQFEQYYRIGKKVAAFCANCHGEGGNSVKTDVPNLAGQNTAYLLDQVRQFADGRRKNEFMQGLMKALSADEKVGIAVFFSNQEVAPQPVKDTGLVAKGKAYYDRICWRCHGDQGRGSEKYARIAGQQVDYLTVTLRRYRDGSATRMDPIMAANTRNMTDADLQAVVAYVSSMK